jgi:hypothetical protein
MNFAVGRVAELLLVILLLAKYQVSASPFVVK